MSSPVYVVEDDLALGDSLILVLRAQGYQPVLYREAAAFLEVLTPAMAGCVLLDLRLPDMDGIEALAKIKAASPTLPVVMMTGYGEIKLAV